MRLCYITYKVDAHNALVGHVVGWIKELARHLEQIEVVCLAAAPTEFPANVRVHSLGKESGVSRIGRWRKFFQVIWNLRTEIDSVFCQFSPEYVIGIAPLAFLRRWPITFWYTHRHVGFRLRLATAFARCIVTATPESFGLKTTKLRVIGHGIDTERFRPKNNSLPKTPTLLAVGRRSPIKNYELLIDSVEILVKQYDWEDLRVRVVGGDQGNAPPAYADQLQERINAAGLSEIVKLVGPVPFDQIPTEYNAASLHINLCPTGGMDKAVLEGMACGTLTLVRNETFRPLLAPLESGLLSGPDRPEVIAEHISTMLSRSEKEQLQLGKQLRQAMLENYGQAAFAKRLSDVLIQASK